MSGEAVVDWEAVEQEVRAEAYEAALADIERWAVEAAAPMSPLSSGPWVVLLDDLKGQLTKLNGGPVR